MMMMKYNPIIQDISRCKLWNEWIFILSTSIQTALGSPDTNKIYTIINRK